MAVITHTEVVPGEVWHAEREVRIKQRDKALSTVIPELGATPRAFLSLGSAAYVIKDQFVWVGTEMRALPLRLQPTRARSRL